MGNFMNDQEIINKAIDILVGRLTVATDYITSAESAKKFLTLKLAEQQREVFAVLFLNQRHGLIEYNEMFFGTINGATIYPREVAKRALEVNAAAVILAHNHPSGNPVASSQDVDITRKIEKALMLFDIDVLDHIIVGAITYSMRENGVL